MSITITDTAAKHVSDHLSSRGKGIGLRLGVKTTGCSGLAYVIEFADKIESDDKILEETALMKDLSLIILMLKTSADVARVLMFNEYIKAELF